MWLADLSISSAPVRKVAVKKLRSDNEQTDLRVAYVSAKTFTFLARVLIVSNDPLD